MSLKVSAILPASPVHEPGSRTEKSPGAHRLQAGENYAQVRRDSLRDQTRVSIILVAGEGSGFAVIVAWNGRSVSRSPPDVKQNLPAEIGLDSGSSQFLAGKRDGQAAGLCHKILLQTTP